MSNQNPINPTTGTEIEIEVTGAEAQVQPVADQVVESNPASEPVAEVKAEPVAEAEYAPLQAVTATVEEAFNLSLTGVKPEPVVAEAKPEPAAEVKVDRVAEARESGRVLKGKVIRVLTKPGQDGKGPIVVGAHVELADFPRLQPKPFLPGSHRGESPDEVKQGATVEVCILPEDPQSKKPGIVVSRRAAQQSARAVEQAAQEAVQLDYLKTLKPGQDVTAKKRRNGKTKGNVFVELEHGFEALLPESGQCAKGTALTVIDVKPERMSVILSEKPSFALTLEGEEVEAKVTAVSIRKKDNREVGRDCLLVDGGINAFMPGSSSWLPDVGETVKVKVDKVEMTDGRLKVVVRPADQPEPQDSGNGAPAGNQGPTNSADQGSGRGNDRGQGYRKEKDGERGHRSEKGRRQDGGRDNRGGNGTGRVRFSHARKEERVDNWGERNGLEQGGWTKGQIVSFEDGRFTVKLASGAEGVLDKSEVSDTEMTDEALKVLVGQTEQFIVLTVNDADCTVRLSLKRVYPASVGWQQPMKGVCSEIRPNHDRIITVGGRLPFKVNGKVPMHYTTAEKVSAISVGDEVTVVLNSVINVRDELTFKLDESQS